VPSHGVDRRRVVFGAWCWGRGLFIHHSQARATTWGARALLAKLLRRARQTHRRIVLVLDQGTPNRPHFILWQLQWL
jgi:hypothetical protein